jgi:hypothetical protein
MKESIESTKFELHITEIMMANLSSHFNHDDDSTASRCNFDVIPISEHKFISRQYVQ